MLIDSHCHLNDEKLLPEAAEIVSGFSEHGIESAICVGYDMPSSETAVELAEKYENLYAVIGIHPHDATTADYDKYERLATLSSSKKVVGIGEIGLDYHYDLSPRAIQSSWSLPTRSDFPSFCTCAKRTRTQRVFCSSRADF